MVRESEYLETIIVMKIPEYRIYFYSLLKMIIVFVIRYYLL